MLTKAELEYYEHSTSALIELVGEVKKLREAVEKCTGRAMPPIQEEPVKEEHPVDSPFDVLAVTDVQVFPFKEGQNMGHIKGLANIVLNDQLKVRGLRIIEGENGLYVSFPIDPFYRGEELRTVVAPVTRQLREHIENCILEKYRDATK